MWLRTLVFLLCMSLKSHYIIHIHIVLNFSVFSFACFPYLDSVFFMFQASSHSCFPIVSMFFLVCVCVCVFCSAWAHNMCYVHDRMCVHLHFSVACCFYRYASIRAIETKSRSDDQQWLTYWVLYSMLTLFELIFAKVLEL